MLRSYLQKIWMSSAGPTIRRRIEKFSSAMVCREWNGWKTGAFPEYLLLLLTFFISIIYVVTPFCDDVRTFFAAARLVDFSGGVDQSWEIKPIGNRMVIYAIYRIAQGGDGLIPQHFEFLAKITYLVAIVLAVWLLIRNERFAGHRITYASAILLSIVTESYFFAMQVEDTANIILIISIALALSEDWRMWVLSGAVLAFLLPLKGITILLALMVPILFYEDRDRIIAMAEGFIPAATVAGMLWLFYLPNGLPDLLSAMAFQGVGLSLSNVYNVFYYLPRVLPYYPLLTAGIISLFFVGRSERIRCGLFYLVAISVVAIQGGGFSTYHYLVLTIPMLYSMYLVRDRIPALLVASIVVTFVAFQFVIPTGDLNLNIPSNMASSEKSWTTFAETYERYNLSSEPEILYLDDGLATYYFGRPSHSRYFTNLPLERTRVFNTPLYNRSIEEVSEYNGEYIVVAPSFIKNPRPDYHLVFDRETENPYYGNIQVYQKCR